MLFLSYKSAKEAASMIKSAGGLAALSKLMSAGGKAVGAAGNKVLNTGSTFAKNYVGAGAGGNLAGASLLQHTASPLRPATPKYWPKSVPTPSQVAHGAAEKLAESGPVGNAALVSLRAGKNLLTTSPLTPALETVKPGLGRLGAPLTAVGLTGAAGYQGSKILPDKVNSALEAIGVTEKDILDKQWWETLKAQPKLLWQSLAPSWAGGDSTAVSKVPGLFAKNLLTDFNSSRFKMPELPSLKHLIKSPAGATASAVASGSVLGNIDYNLHQGLPATVARTVLDAANSGVNAKDLKNSELVKTIREMIHPDVVKALDAKIDQRKREAEMLIQLARIMKQGSISVLRGVSLYPALKSGTATFDPPANPLYRNRAEVFARDRRGRIYGGIWDMDKSFAVPGGGIDDGEDIPTAAAREFLEETGLTIKNPRLLPIAPVTHLWDPSQRAKRPLDRQKYDGSQSHFVEAEIDDSVPLRTGPLDQWGANNRGYYTPRKALKLMNNVVPLSPETFAARKRVLEHLLSQRKSAHWLGGVLVKLAFEGPVRRRFNSRQESVNVVDARDPENARLHEAELVNRWVNNPIVKDRTEDQAELDPDANPMKDYYLRMRAMGAEAQGSDLHPAGFPNSPPTPEMVVGSNVVNDGLPEQEYLRKQYGDLNDALRDSAAKIAPSRVKLPLPRTMTYTGSKGVGTMDSIRPGNYYPGGVAVARPVVPVTPAPATVAKPVTPAPTVSAPAIEAPTTPIKSPSLLKGAFLKQSAAVPTLIHWLDHDSTYSRQQRVHQAIDDRIRDAIYGKGPPVAGGWSVPEPPNRIYRYGPDDKVRDDLSVRNRSPITSDEIDKWAPFMKNPEVPTPGKPVSASSGWVMPAALLAGGVGLGALGVHLYNRYKKPKKQTENAQPFSLIKGAAVQLFDDEEEDKPVKSKSWLPTLALGAGGILGGVALGHYLNSKPQYQMMPPKPPAAPPQTPTQTHTAPTQTPTAPPKPPVQPPAAAPQPPQVTTGGIKPPVAPPQPQPAANAAVATGVGSAAAGPVRATSPVFQTPQGISPLHQRLYNEPEKLLAEFSAIDPAKATSAQKEGLRNLISQYYGSMNKEGPTPFPKLHEYYSAGYAGDQQAMQRAKVYQQILARANQIGLGQNDFGNLNSLAAVDTSVPPVNNVQPFKIPGLETLSAFGYKDIQSLANAAAEGDPNVLTAVKALSHEDKYKLFESLSDTGYRQVTSGKDTIGLAPMVADPRAAALVGALQHAATSPGLQPAAYNPAELANADALKALTPEQKIQLINDFRNPDVMGKALSSLPPEAKQQAINNLANTFARNAYTRLKDNTDANIPDYLDPNIQTTLARLKGLKNYQPLDPEQWRDMSAMGGNLGEFLSPYKIRATNALRTPHDIGLERQSGPEDYPGYSPTQILTSASPEADQNIVNDWTKVLTSNLRKNFSSQDADLGLIPRMTNDQLSPLMIGLGRLKAYRPDVYQQVVDNLQQQYGKIPGTYSRTDRQNVPAYKDQITEDTPMLDYNWADKLNWFLDQRRNGWNNPLVGKSHDLSGLREVQLDQLPD